MLLAVLAAVFTRCLTMEDAYRSIHWSSLVLVAGMLPLTDALNVSPYPFAVAVLIAASSAYSTPVSTPVVTLVVDPGRYRFTDFVKVGVPLVLLSYLVTLLLAPIVFPFAAT